MTIYYTTLSGESNRKLQTVIPEHFRSRTSSSARKVLAHKARSVILQRSSPFGVGDQRLNLRIPDRTLWE